MKKITNILIFLCSLASVCIFVKDYSVGASDKFLSDLSTILVLLIPKIIRKIFKLKITDVMEFVYVVFVILAQFIGSVVNLYNMTSWYDLFTHFLSGILTTILALVIMNWMGVYKENKKVFNVLFIICFTLMVASVWEFTEYLADVIMKSNVQHSLETGVSDTMEDMLIAFLGSIIVAVTYFFEGKNGFIKKIVSKIK